ncbi:MAG: hypothetical protein ACT4O0_07200 [Pseudonocardia sp.]
MSAPTIERTRRAAIPAPRTDVGAARGSTSGAVGGAVGKAYARRAGRRERLVEPVGPGTAGRSRFVLLVMALFATGLVASLWLSTTAAADSYRLSEATRATRDLSERTETLRTEIAALSSAPALAQAARAQGMVPTSDVARLVAMPDGSVVVVGTPKAAVAPAPPPGVLPPALPGVAPVQPGAAGQQAVVPGQQAVVPVQPGAAGQQGNAARQQAVVAVPRGAAVDRGAGRG